MPGWENVPRDKRGEWTGDGAPMVALHRDARSKHASAARRAWIKIRANKAAAKAAAAAQAQRAKPGGINDSLVARALANAKPAAKPFAITPAPATPPAAPKAASPLLKDQGSRDPMVFRGNAPVQNAQADFHQREKDKHVNAAKKAWVTRLANQKAKAAGQKPEAKAGRPDEPRESIISAHDRASDEAIEVRLRAGSRDTAKDIGSHVVATKDLNQGNVGLGPYKLTLDTGEVVVFKDANGEHGMPGNRGGLLRPGLIKPGMQTERESMAWEVAKLTKMRDLVTPAVAVTVNGKKGVALGWAPGVIAANAPSGKMFDGNTDLARAAVFDYVIGNEDRHGKNWHVEGNQLHLLDHGLAFPDSSGTGDWNHKMIDQAKFEEGMRHKVKIASPASFASLYANAKPEILAKMRERKFSPEAVKGVGDRIDSLASAAHWQDLKYEGKFRRARNW